MVASSWSTGQTWSSPISLAHSPSHRAPSPYLGPLLTATHSQRWARVQPRAENSPTVAAEPGENLPSQNRPKKDVFPTEELPTNTILKSRSGVDGEPSFCGRQTVGSTTGTVTSPRTCHPHPSLSLWRPGRDQQPAREAAPAPASDARSFGFRAPGLLPTSDVERETCIPAPLMPVCWATDPVLGWVCGGGKEAVCTESQHDVPSVQGARSGGQGSRGAGCFGLGFKEEVEVFCAE